MPKNKQTRTQRIVDLFPQVLFFYTNIHKSSRLTSLTQLHSTAFPPEVPEISIEILQSGPRQCQLSNIGYLTHCSVVAVLSSSSSLFGPHQVYIASSQFSFCLWHHVLMPGVGNASSITFVEILQNAPLPWFVLHNSHSYGNRPLPGFTGSDMMWHGNSQQPTLKLPEANSSSSSGDLAWFCSSCSSSWTCRSSMMSNFFLDYLTYEILFWAGRKHDHGEASGLTTSISLG